jgi:hypothetical protein
MNVPGFTAAASIYQRSGRYLTAVRALGSGGAGIASDLNRVIPFRPVPPQCDPCYWNSDPNDGPIGACLQLCLDKDGSVYVQGCDDVSGCPEKCGRCLPMPLGGPPGLWRYCVGGASGAGQYVQCLGRGGGK